MKTRYNFDRIYFSIDCKNLAWNWETRAAVYITIKIIIDHFHIELI